MDRARVEQLRLAYEHAQSQLLQEDGERFRVIMRDIAEEEKQRILDNLSDKREKILFGLAAPEEAKRTAASPGKSGGELTCEICGKGGLTARGLGLHKSRVHGIKPGSPEGQAQAEDASETEGEEGSSSRRKGFFPASTNE
jgi:hypothetical protein